MAPCHACMHLHAMHTAMYDAPQHDVHACNALLHEHTCVSLCNLDHVTSHGNWKFVLISPELGVHIECRLGRGLVSVSIKLYSI